MSSESPPTINDTKDRYQFDDSEIKNNISKMSDIDIYKVVTSNSLEGLARRIRYFKQLNPDWTYLGAMIYSPEKTKISEYRKNNTMGDLISVYDDGNYRQTFVRATTTTATQQPQGGSIRQNSRKIRLQRKKRD